MSSGQDPSKFESHDSLMSGVLLSPEQLRGLNSCYGSQWNLPTELQCQSQFGPEQAAQALLGEWLNELGTQIQQLIAELSALYADLTRLSSANQIRPNEQSNSRSPNSFNSTDNALVCRNVPKFTEDTQYALIQFLADLQDYVTVKWILKN
ncbi:hypothetical protein U1Q18_051240 [Sarracenia purpurea var. burkii]